jgi:hypothetical protein
MLIVNFYGGPGCGKSTTAAQTFGHLKMAGYRAELVTEFAKDLTWDASMKQLGYQPLVFAQQAWRLERLRGQVDVVVTDSPLLLSLIYASPEAPQCFLDYIRWEASRDDAVHFLLRRVKPYQPFGRSQDEAAARELDDRIRLMLSVTDTHHELLTGDGSASTIAFAKIVSHIAKTEKK